MHGRLEVISPQQLNRRCNLECVGILGQAGAVVGVGGEAAQVGHALRDVQEGLVLQADHAARVGALGVLGIAAGDAQQDADAVKILMGILGIKIAVRQAQAVGLLIRVTYRCARYELPRAVGRNSLGTSLRDGILMRVRV